MLIEDFKPQEVEWCDGCRDHVSGQCDVCQRPFPAGQTQYRSQSHHFHPAHIEGIPGTFAIQKLLCLDCYRLDWQKVYPKEPIPV